MYQIYSKISFLKEKKKEVIIMAVGLKNTSYIGVITSSNSVVLLKQRDLLDRYKASGVKQLKSLIVENKNEPEIQCIEQFKFGFLVGFQYSYQLLSL